jgi:hypothetical protein
MRPRGGGQRAVGRHVAGEQPLEEIAPLAIGVGHEVLLELDVGVARVGAREVDIAHERRGECERRLVAARLSPAHSTSVSQNTCWPTRKALM